MFTEGVKRMPLFADFIIIGYAAWLKQEINGSKGGRHVRNFASQRDFCAHGMSKKNYAG